MRSKSTVDQSVHKMESHWLDAILHNFSVQIRESRPTLQSKPFLETFVTQFRNLPSSVRVFLKENSILRMPQSPLWIKYYSAAKFKKRLLWWQAGLLICVMYYSEDEGKAFWLRFKGKGGPSTLLLFVRHVDAGRHNYECKLNCSSMQNFPPTIH